MGKQSARKSGDKKMQHLAHWLAVNGSVLAVLVTVGVAVLIVCCLQCTKCDCREIDDLFKRHGV